MSTNPTHSLNLRLAELLGLTPDVLRHVTGFTLHVESDDVPRMEVRRAIVDDGLPRHTTQRFKLTPVEEDDAPPEPAALDLEAMAAAARTRVQLCIDQMANKHREAIKFAFIKADCRMWTGPHNPRPTRAGGVR